MYFIISASQLEDDCLTPKLYWIKCIKCTTQTNFKLQLQAPVKLFALQQHQRKLKICCMNVVFLFYSFVEPTQGFKRNRNIVSRKFFVSPKTFKFFVFLMWKKMRKFFFRKNFSWQISQFLTKLSHFFSREIPHRFACFRKVFPSLETLLYIKCYHLSIKLFFELLIKLWNIKSTYKSKIA